MTSAEIEQLRVDIDAAVPRLGGPPKVKGSDLNAVLRRLNDGLASSLPPEQLAALAASAAPSAENAYATRADLAPLAEAATAATAGAAYPAAVASPGQAPRPYATIFAAVAAARAGEALHLRQPLAEPVGPNTEAVIDLKADVVAYLHGHDISSPDTVHDIVTFRGGKNVLYGGHATISQRDTGGGAGSWFVGTYGGPTIDATIHDLHLRLDTYKSVGFALFGGGTYAYRGTVRSVGRYVLRMSPGANNQLFTGEGSIWQQGGTLFWLQSATARAEWRGDITALDNSLFNIEAGTVVLRQGYLHADVRPAGAELVVQGGPTSTLILENYTFGGVPGATVGHVGTLVLRGNSVVIGNLLADKVIDERPLAPSAARTAAPPAPAALTLPNAVPARVAQFAPAATRTVAAYEITQDGGATWAPAPGPTLPVPLAGVAAGQLGVRVAATPEGAPASAATYLPATGPARTVVGLRARYYAGCFGDDPTFFRGKKPLFEETLAHAGRFRDPVFDNFGRVYGSLEQFSVLYDGQLLITESGTYSFNYSADDKGGIWLDESVLDPRNDNRADRRGGLYLEAGLHPILLAYGEYGGLQYADYYWDGPGVNDILNAGRLRLFTNEPLPADTHRAPAGQLPDANFDQPMSAATWAPVRGWDVVDGTLLGTDTDLTTTTFELPPPSVAPVAYTLEVSLDLAPGAQLHVGLAGFTPAETKLTTSGVHRLALTPGGGGKGRGQVQLRAEASQLVRVHYAQLLTATVTPGSSTFVEDSDPRCAYTGAWQSEANEETIYRDNEGKYVNPSQDAAVRLSFSGTQVRIWACTSANPADAYTTRARIFIDDEEQPAASQQVANPSGDLPRSWAWYTSPLLPAGPHTIRLQADPSTGQYLVFDGFEVVGDGNTEPDTEVDPGTSAEL